MAGTRERGERPLYHRGKRHVMKPLSPMAPIPRFLYRRVTQVPVSHVCMQSEARRLGLQAAAVIKATDPPKHCTLSRAHIRSQTLPS